MLIRSLRSAAKKEACATRQGPRPAKPRRSLRCRPALETLEVRTVPAVINWINPAGGDWSVAANWDLGRKPAPADDAVINIANIQVTHQKSDHDVINSLFSRCALQVKAGKVEIHMTHGQAESKIEDYLRIDLGGELIVTSATIAGSGTIENFDSVEFNYSHINLTYENHGKTKVRGASSFGLSPIMKEGSVLRVEGNKEFGNASLTVAQGLINNGALELTSADGP
jgi:type VI protein secretion system component Hcp